MKILALDLGKNKTLLCDYVSETGQHEFETVRTDATAPAAMPAWRRPDRVVFEVGPSAGWVADLVRSQGVDCEVANPSHQGWRWRNVKIIAVARRLLVRCWAMLRDGRRWSPPLRAAECAEAVFAGTMPSGTVPSGAVSPG
jgi:hypothetical protein